MVSKRGNSYNGNLLLCMAKKEKGEIEEAIIYANKLIEMDRNKVDGYELKGEIEIIRGKDDGYKEFDKAIKISISKGTEIIKIIKLLGEIVKKGIKRYKEVEWYIYEKMKMLEDVRYEDSKEKEEIEEEIIRIKGEELKKEKKYDEMLRYGQEMVSKRGNSYNGNLLLCMAKKEKGEIEEAIIYANKLIEIDRSKVDGYELKVEIEVIRGKDDWYKVLDEIFNLYIKSENKIYGVFCNIIKFANKDADFINLKRYILKIGDVNNKKKLLMNLYIKQIDLCIKDFKLKEAMKLANEAIKLDKNNYDILSTLGLLNIFDNNHYKANKYLTKAICVDDRKIFAYVLFGRLRLEQNNIEGTKEMFQKALDLSKDNNDKKNTLKILFSELQHVKYSPSVDIEVISSVKKWLENIKYD
jgi:tetratricopeptide (TPR) repeat protein